MFENRLTIISPLIGIALPLLLSACGERTRVEDVESLRKRLVFTVDENDKITVKDGLDNTIQPIKVDPADPIGSIIKRHKDRGKDIRITNGGSSVFFKFIGSDCKCKGSGYEVYCVPEECG